MDSRLLEMFLRVAETGSINRAAALLHVSQPALSRHIAALEHEMGAALFTRSRGGVALTESGRLLADRARPLLRQFARLREEVADTATGHLSIGIPPSWRHVFTTEFLQTLLVGQSGIKLRVHEGVSHALRDLLLAGSLDLGLVPYEPAVPAGFTQTPLLREPIILVGPTHAGLEPSRAMPLQSLAELPLVLPARPNVLRSRVEQGLQRLGHRTRIMVETDTLLLCLDLARAGLGYTAVPACALSGHAVEARFTGISWAPLRGLYLTWSLYENSIRSHAASVRVARTEIAATLQRTLAAQAWFGGEAMPGLQELFESTPPTPWPSAS